MPAASFLASQVFDATGSQTDWTFSFYGVSPDDTSGATPYIDPADVKAQEIVPATETEPETRIQRDVVLVNANTARVSPAVAVGRKVRIYRETENRYPLVNYQALQAVSEADLDLANRQAVFIVQEARDLANGAGDLDAEALSAALLLAEQAATSAAEAVTAAEDSAEQAALAAASAADAAAAVAGVDVTALRLAGKPITDFGVVGDGVTDDTVAMQLVAAYDGPVLGLGLTILCNQLDFTAPLKLDLQGGTLLVKDVFQRFDILSNGVEIRNGVIDVQGNNVNVALFRITAGYVDYVFEDLLIKNITGIIGSENQYGFYIDADNGRGRLERITFENISNVSAGVPVSGFCGGLLLATTTVGAERIDLNSITCKNIFNTGYAGDINNTDADGIRIFGSQPTVRSNVFIRDFLAIDVMKSGIKASGARGLSISGAKIVNNRSDIGMVAGIRLQAADDSTLTNVVLEGRMSVGLNIRSSNILVDGVVYAPIDASRDYVESGLVQLQSNDTYQTADVQIANVRATNVRCPFDFDNTGTTVNYVFRRISFRDWDVTSGGVASVGVAGRIRKAIDVAFDGVRFYDIPAQWLTLVDVFSSANLRFLNCRFHARRTMFTWTSDVNIIVNIEFRGCEFVRHDTAATDNLAVMNMRGASNEALDRVAFVDCKFDVPGYSAIGNQHCITATTTRGHYAGILIRVRSGGSNNPPSGYVALGNGAVGNYVGHVQVIAEAAMVGGGGYAVDLASGAVNNVINGVMANLTPGVRAAAGANNNILNNVIGKTAAIANSGTGNQVGSQVIIP